MIRGAPAAHWFWIVMLPYVALLSLLSLYALHRWAMIWIYWRHRKHAPAPARRLDPLPALTVQLPLFNELYVAPRALEAVSRLDWPRERLEIQVLDDSTDETSEIVARHVAALRADGLDVVQLRRDRREGFKAGALDAGLRVARGELIAVFDADFVPAPDFARRLADHFADPRVGMVQARWGHLNAGHSVLTRVQALLLDGHFVIEHTARSRSGRFFNFNGTAGIWRRSCIEDAGGWQHDTLTEDLDLSYRAQLRGWRFVYERDHVAPAELPVEIAAFHAQQERWAKGAVQTARKLLPALLRSRLPWRVKLDAATHLTANVGYPLVLLVGLLLPLAVWVRGAGISAAGATLDLALFGLCSSSIVAFYAMAHREAGGSTWSAVRRIPALMALAIGLSPGNGRAVLEALLGQASEFRRTPKFDLAPGEDPAGRRYRSRFRRGTLVELALFVYFAGGAALAARLGLWGPLPFLLLFGAGFGATTALALAQRPPRRSAA